MMGYDGDGGGRARRWLDGNSTTTKDKAATRVKSWYGALIDDDDGSQRTLLPACNLHNPQGPHDARVNPHLASWAPLLLIAHHRLGYIGSNRLLRHPYRTFHCSVSRVSLEPSVNVTQKVHCYIEKLKWRSSLTLGSSIWGRWSKSKADLLNTGGSSGTGTRANGGIIVSMTGVGTGGGGGMGESLKKCHTSPWLALGPPPPEPMKPVNRLRHTSIMCSRCSSLLSMASSSRYSITADGQYVQVSEPKPPSPAPSVLCKLCLANVPASETWTLECSCSFCTDCMKAYVGFEISQGAYDISCPDAMCEAQGVISLSEIENLVNSDTMEKHKRYRLNKEVDQDMRLAWCPSAGCETVCTLNPQSTPHRVHCPSCSTDFCSLCRGPWHPSGPCPQAGPAPGIPFDSDLIKCCPMCAVPIEKDEGCAQMMCKRCKHVFCWYCLASLDDDFLLRHYDKGPCKNKLGHSRASVIWHRTQVIGIFAGFGILLLVASPLLLLAAPCIVCCKCRVCTGGPKLDAEDDLPEESAS